MMKGGVVLHREAVKESESGFLCKIKLDQISREAINRRDKP